MNRDERIACAVVGGLFPHIGSVATMKKDAARRGDERRTRAAQDKQHKQARTARYGRDIASKAGSAWQNPNRPRPAEQDAQQDPYSSNNAPQDPYASNNAPWFAPQQPGPSYDLSPWGYGPQPSPTDDYYGATPDGADYGDDE